MSVHQTPGGWAVRWRQEGRHRSRTFPKRGEAEHFDHFMKHKRRMGVTDPLITERPFGDFVEEWFKSHQAHVSKMTRTNYLGWLERYILPRFEGMRLCDVRAPDLIEFRGELERKGVGAASIRKILFVLSAIFNHVQRMGYLDYNPMQVVKKPPAHRQRLIHPFPPEKVEALRGWFLERDDLASATLISVLAYAGPRPHEAHEVLSWGDIGQTTIIFRSNKTQTDRSTRLLAPLKEDLKLWRGARDSYDIGSVFDWTMAKFNNWRGGPFKKATKAIGIDLTRPYDLRHSFATLMIQQGVSLGTLAREMGNSVTTCDRWYAHLEMMDEDRRPAEERIWAARGVRPGFAESEADTP